MNFAYHHINAVKLHGPLSFIAPFRMPFPIWHRRNIAARSCQCQRNTAPLHIFLSLPLASITTKSCIHPTFFYSYYIYSPTIKTPYINRCICINSSTFPVFRLSCDQLLQSVLPPLPPRSFDIILTRFNSLSFIPISQILN